MASGQVVRQTVPTTDAANLTKTDNYCTTDVIHIAGARGGDAAQVHIDRWVKSVGGAAGSGAAGSDCSFIAEIGSVANDHGGAAGVVGGHLDGTAGLVTEAGLAV